MPEASGCGIARSIQSIVYTGRSAVPIVVGGLFIWAAASKWRTPEASAHLVTYLTGMNESRTVLAVRGLALAEWVLGLALVAGLAPIMFHATAIVMVAGFSLVLCVALHRGFEETCGCLGLGESVQAALIRNGVILAILAVAGSCTRPGSALSGKGAIA